MVLQAKSPLNVRCAQLITDTVVIMSVSSSQSCGLPLITAVIFLIYLAHLTLVRLLLVITHSLLIVQRRMSVIYQ